MVSQSWLDSAADLATWLASKKWQIVTAESCTGGGIGYAMSALPGSSEWFCGGFITYSNTLKQQLLAVPPQTIECFGAVSAETAAAMASGALQASGAQLAIAVTGAAGPAGGSASKPVGLVWFGLAWPTGVITWHKHFSGDRAAVREATINEALQSFKKILDTV
jgi:nicotinamide-nucleotide amidase